MIEDSVIEDYLSEEVLIFYCFLYRCRQQSAALNLHNRGRGLSVHEFIKGLQFSLGKDVDFLPIPEYKPLVEKGWRIDVLWTDWDGNQVAAFEVDQTLYPKSVRKLKLLVTSCRKYIVTSGKGTSQVDLSLIEGTGIVRFDMSQAGLSALEHFSSQRRFSN